MKKYNGFQFDERIHAADAVELARLVTSRRLMTNKMEAARLCLGMLGNATCYVEVAPKFKGEHESLEVLAEEIEHEIARPKGTRGWLDGEFAEKVLELVWQVLQDLGVFV